MPESTPAQPTPAPTAVQVPAPAELPAVLALADRAAAVDGHPPLNDQTRAVLGRAGQRWWGVTRDPVTGAPTGVAVVAPEAEADGPAVAELVVDPAHRRRGLGTALADAAAAAVQDAPAGSVSAWAHGDLPGSRALAARHGLAPARELRRMRLEGAPLASLPPVRLPDGVRVRAFEPGQDEQAWLALNADAFAHHPEQGSLTRVDLDARTAEPWFRAPGLLLAEQAADGSLLGYHWTKVVDEDGTAAGEVYAVGVTSAAQGRGLGRALTLAGLHHMAALPVHRVDLYVDADNVPAVRLYDSLGFTLVAADVQHRRR